MDIDIERFNKLKDKTEHLYKMQFNVRNPYLNSQIIFNSDGFHHLQFSARRERNKKEQILKFNLFSLAVKVIKNAGTLQEYRKSYIPIGKKSKDGFARTKEVQYWGFVALVGNPQIKIRVILRRVGDGNITFWSVMPVSKLKNHPKLYTEGIEND